MYKIKENPEDYDIYKKIGDRLEKLENFKDNISKISKDKNNLTFKTKDKKKIR